MNARWLFDGLTPMKYGAILADPPWAYDMRSDKGHAKSPKVHYQTMAPEAIKALPVRELAGPHCLLFLWSTWPHLPLALEVMTAWGFTFKTGGAWVKRTPTGKAVFGTGYLLRSATEPFLIGTVGRPEIKSKSVRNLIDALRREHSRKPPEARDMIDLLLPGVWACELFAREPWPGRDIWGDQVGRFG